MIRNITFAAPATITKDAPIEDTTLRIRSVTVSPIEEYQLREGNVRPISNELAAAILSFKGRAIVGNKGVVVDRKDIGGRFVYFHENSITINDFSSRERKLFYVINRMAPEILHLLDETGGYIESLPLRERPAVLDNAAQAEQIRQNKTVINRAANRLQELHAPATREILENLKENAAIMSHVVMTLPAEGSSDTEAQQETHRSTHGEAVAAAINDIKRGTYERNTNAHADRAETTRDVLDRRSKPTECPF